MLQGGLVGGDGGTLSSSVESMAAVGIMSQIACGPA
jgi:hypothetical protein